MHAAMEVLFVDWANQLHNGLLIIGGVASIMLRVIDEDVNVVIVDDGVECIGAMYVEACIQNIVPIRGNKS
jgi:hypothetical protein